MAKSISHAQGKGNLAHNNRDFVYSNVDQSKTKNNITYVKQSLDDAYGKCFGQAVEEYNNKQKRADRRIDDYYKSLFGEASKTNVATSAHKEKSYYEVVVGIGSMFDTAVGTPDGELATKCLDEYMKGFQERNPQFHVFNAVLHMDEKTPHLHIDYVPVASGYKNGMNKRNSISKALANMGYGTDKDCINNWRLAECGVLENICKEHGIEIKPPEKGRGKTLTPEEYKKHAQEGFKEGQKQFYEEYDAFSELNKEIQELVEERKRLQAEIKNEKTELQEWRNQEQNKKITIAKTKYDKLPQVNYSKHESIKPNILSKNNDEFVKVPKADYKLMKEREGLHRQVITLGKNNNESKKELDEYKKELKQQEINIKNEKAEMCEVLKDVVKTIGVLKYGDDKYKANLTPAQERLVDVTSNYASEYIRQEGFSDVADEIDKKIAISISNEIKKHINALIPKTPKPPKPIQQIRNIMQNLDNKSRQAKQQNERTAQRQTQTQKNQKKKQNDHDI